MEKPVTNKSEATVQKASAPVGPQPAPKTEATKGMGAPMISAVKPNKHADVPKYAACMASDPSRDRKAIDGVRSGAAKRE